MHHTDSHGFAMDIFSVPAQGFQCVTDRMSIIQNAAQTRFPFILAHHLRLDLTTTLHDRLDVRFPHIENAFHSIFQKREKFSIGNDPVLNHFGQPGYPFTPGQGS